MFIRRRFMKIYKEITAAILSGLLVAGLCACEKEGPAEKAGKAVDEAASNVADEANEVAESVEKKMGE
jgi:outer membrane murein-binding lipoprotein Lpp